MTFFSNMANRKFIDVYKKLGSLNIVTGIPMSGKSEFMDAMMINTIGLHKWQWAIYSPENMPIPFHFQKLAEKFVQKPMFGNGRMTQDEMMGALAYINKNIHVLMTEDVSLSLEDILLRLRVCIDKFGIKGFILDPYNEVEHTMQHGESETAYISRFLSTMRNFARKHNIALFIIAHPTKLQKKEDGDYPVPTPYDISGSAHWRNKADNCISLWRSFKNDVQNKNKVSVWIQKVRNKNIGQLGSCDFTWNYSNGIFTPVDLQKIKYPYLEDR